MDSIDSQLITALILCGGQAIRMGQDKGLPIKDQPLVQWTIQRSKNQVGSDNH
jgi:molybdopterin-guanine dinucleotide biosynthesis protein A